MKSMDFKSICRICLESNRETFDIYTNYYTKKKLLYCEILTKCTNIKPYEEDGLPRLICKDCRRQLKRTYAFSRKCQTSEIVLRTYLSNLLPPQPIVDSLVVDDNVEDKKSKAEAIDENTDGALKENEAKCEIKIEQIDDDDEGNNSSWDADDDNIILGEIKLKKALKESIHNSNDSNKLVKESIQNANGDTTKNVKDVIAKKRKVRKRLAPDEVHQCDVCGKVLSTRSNLKAHKICHTSLRPFRCDDCPATFRGYSALFQHRKVHSRVSSYHCEYCSKPFRRRTNLVNHIRAHTGEKLYNCTICFKKFVQKVQLTTHIKRHKGDKSYLCQDCGKGFPVKSDLTVHQRTHNGEKPYACRLCEKRFATSGNLAIHIRIHNREIKYNCAECQRGFVTYSSYNVHVKRHKGQRDYGCECGKRFYTSSALKQHRYVHSGLKRYQCRVCERRFAQPSHLTRHFRREHAAPDAPLPPRDSYRRVLPDRAPDPSAPE